MSSLACLVLPLLVLFSMEGVIAQPLRRDITERVGLSCGMGVNYHAAKDIVDRINGSGITSQRVGEFKSAVEFFAAAAVPLSESWVIKGEYAYMFTSQSLASRISSSAAEFSYDVHMPSVILQYVLFSAPTYAVKAGAGAGYHFAVYNEKYSSFNRTFRAGGVGSLLELEGNNALGDNLAVYLGVQGRWDFVGDLKDASGMAPLGNLAATSLHFFSVGARLGATYFF